MMNEFNAYGRRRPYKRVSPKSDTVSVAIKRDVKANEKVEHTGELSTYT